MNLEVILEVKISKQLIREKTINCFWPFLAKLLVTKISNFAQDLVLLGSTTMFFNIFVGGRLDFNNRKKLTNITTTTTTTPAILDLLGYAAGKNHQKVINPRFADGEETKCFFPATNSRKHTWTKVTVCKVGNPVGNKEYGLCSTQYMQSDFYSFLF